jgi:hypothetical protein
MAPGDPFIMDSMGWVQYRMGKLDEGFLRRAYACATIRKSPCTWAKCCLPRATWLARKDVEGSPGQGSENDALKSTLARLNQSL